MKYLIVFLLISSNSLASTEKDLIRHIKMRCGFFNPQTPLNYKLHCMENYINCSVTNNGKIDLSKADEKCLTTKEKLHE